MRIAFLPSNYLPHSVGGTEIYVHHLSEALARLGHEVAVAYHAPTPAAERARGPYEVVPLPACPPRRRADLYLHSRGEEPTGFAGFLTEWKPDVAHFHACTLGASLDHARLLRRHGVPYLVTYHTPAASCPRGTLMYRGREACDGRTEPGRCAACVLQGRGWAWPLAALLGRSPLRHDRLPEGPWLPRVALPSLLEGAQANWREFMGHAEHVIACAEWCKEVLIRNGVAAEKVRVVRQGLPGASRRRTLRLPLASGRPLRIGYFGRFAWSKGPDLLLRAAEQLRRDGLDVRCELTGPIASNEERWARRLLARHAASVVYHDTRQRDELRGWLGGLDLVAVPSRTLETGPLTLLEAWDEGVPVVGTGNGGIREFLDGAGLGALAFEPAGVDGLVAAVRRAAAWPGGDRPEVHVPGMAELAERMVMLYEQALSVSAN
jgi:glycosyltransferase involved in cell wall biosynthesis